MAWQYKSSTFSMYNVKFVYLIAIAFGMRDWGPFKVWILVFVQLLHKKLAKSTPAVQTKYALQLALVSVTFVNSKCRLFL
jgi:hypothetical protein